VAASSQLSDSESDSDPRLSNKRPNPIKKHVPKTNFRSLDEMNERMRREHRNMIGEVLERWT
jgi:hypothetical protein